MLLSSANIKILEQKMTFKQLASFLDPKKFKIFKRFCSFDKPETVSGLLQVACTIGNLEAVKYLTEPDLHYTRSYIFTRLAAGHGHLQILKHLLDSGFPVKQCALDYALEKNNIPEAKLLLKEGLRTNHFCVTHLASEGNLKALEILIDTDHEIKPEALVRAAEAGHVQVVRLLASRMDSIPEEALTRARKRGLWYICLILEHYGASPRSSNYAWKKFVKKC